MGTGSLRAFERKVVRRVLYERSFEWIVYVGVIGGWKGASSGRVRVFFVFSSANIFSFVFSLIAILVFFVLDAVWGAASSSQSERGSEQLQANGDWWCTVCATWFDKIVEASTEMERFERQHIELGVQSNRDYRIGCRKRYKWSIEGVQSSTRGISDNPGGVSGTSVAKVQSIEATQNVDGTWNESIEGVQSSTRGISDNPGGVSGTSGSSNEMPSSCRGAKHRSKSVLLSEVEATVSRLSRSEANVLLAGSRSRSSRSELSVSWSFDR
ncbi:hypothetical protein M405DRAFT_847909 [Rhizopogon salebrosus TDB-379]|nr:hypothetical protein M405DRAFT_847909 [Rhizopogon salebrosus TDB-379]